MEIYNLPMIHVTIPFKISIANGAKLFENILTVLLSNCQCLT